MTNKNEKLIDSLYPITAIKGCMTELNKNENAIAYESPCGHLILDNDEEVQVKIIVTRNMDDFLGPFDIVEYT